MNIWRRNNMIILKFKLNLMMQEGFSFDWVPGFLPYRDSWLSFKNGLATNDKSDKPAEYYLSSDCLRSEPKVFWEYEKSNMYYPDKTECDSWTSGPVHPATDALSYPKTLTACIEKREFKTWLNFTATLSRSLSEVHKTVDYKDYLKSMYHETAVAFTPRHCFIWWGLIRSPFQRVLTPYQELIWLSLWAPMRVYPFAGLINYRSQMPMFWLLTPKNSCSSASHSRWSKKTRSIFKDEKVNA